MEKQSMPSALQLDHQSIEGSDEVILCGAHYITSRLNWRPAQYCEAVEAIDEPVYRV